MVLWNEYLSSNARLAWITTLDTGLTGRFELMRINWHLGIHCRHKRFTDPQ